MKDSHPYTDQALLSALAEGKEWAMKHLFNAYYSRIYYYAFKLVADDMEAQDIAQEAILALWQKRIDFSTSSLRAAEAFLFTVARNRCFNFIRNLDIHHKKHAMLASNAMLSDESFEHSFIREDIFNRIYEEIIQLAPAQTELLKLIFIDHLETNEIAEKLGITPNNVRNMKARALEKLKTALLRKRLLTPILLLFKIIL